MVTTTEVEYNKHRPEHGKFATAFPQMEALAKAGRNVLDSVSQKNLDDLRARMRANKPRPATIVNLLPWKLIVTGGSTFQGIEVPACPPGVAFTHQHIRYWKTDTPRYNEDCTAFLYDPIYPIQIAREFVRVYCNRERFGGGVIVYEGDGHPDKVDMVETYDDSGLPITSSEYGIEEGQEGEKIEVVIQAPIRQKYNDIYRRERGLRNAMFKRKVEVMNRDYQLPDGKGRRNLTDNHILMAEVLFAEGVISEKPKWSLVSRLDEGLEAFDCPKCGEPRKKNAYACRACNNILDALAAYKDYAIDFDNVKMDMLTSDELEAANEIRVEREQAKKAKKDKRKEPAPQQPPA